MTQPDLWSVAPSAVQARRSGRQRGVQTLRSRMVRYRDYLLARGPQTDHDAAEALDCPLSVVNAIRGDWKLYAEHHGIPNPVVASGRVKQVWAKGKSTTRTTWRWQA